MPDIEEPLNTIHVRYDPRFPESPSIIRVGYFSTSARAPVLDLVIDWSPDDGEYWDAAITVLLANPDMYIESAIAPPYVRLCFHKPQAFT